MIPTPRLRFTLLAPALLAFAVTAEAQDRTTNPTLTTEAFLRPPGYIADAVLAPRYLNVTLGNPSPDGRFFVQQQGDGPPSMATFAKPFYRLGGEQIDWQANRSRILTQRSGKTLVVTDGQTGATTTIQVPDDARVTAPQWSPDGTQLAFFAHFETETHIFVADPTNGRARQLTRSPVLATLYTSFEWMPDSRSILTMLPPENRGPAPQKPAVPTTPQVRLTEPGTNSIRTYPDLLEGPFEKELLEYYATGQLAIVEVGNRRTRRIGQPAMISGVDVSPDGMYAQVTAMQRPFSYIVPRRQFGSTTELWSMEDGSVLTLLSEQELRDGSPQDTSENEPEKRNITWRPDGQGLSYLLQDPRQPDDSAQADPAPSQGPPGRPGGRGGARRPDRVYQWLPPFDDNSATEIYENDTQLQNVRYSEDGQVLFLREQQGENGHEFAVFLSDLETKHTLWRGKGGGGGRGGGFRGGGRAPSIMTKQLGNGTSVVRTSSDGSSAFLSGTKFQDDPMTDGPRTYIDRIEIQGGEKTRIFESDNDNVFERVLAVMDDDATQLIVSREGPTDVPNSYRRDLSTGQLQQLTHNTDYTPDLTKTERRRYNIKRVDGLEIAVNVTLPPNWDGERLPGMIWFYPREYTDQENYDERTRETYNKNRFPNIGSRSMEIMALQGYAVIQPDAPIIGDEGRMNDNYVHDLRNNLSAVIDFLEREAIIDRNRMGVGGHSYGAFSTFNAMVHTPFFKAGIAGDGNNNRTLTPFSFQSERRTLWQAREVYLDMSAFFHADHLQGALLMYHGEHDQNVGTFPIHSWRLFEALEALDKTASLYVYPFEDHGPATEETLLDLWARWTAWLDEYVKGDTDANVTSDGSDASQN
ncbi:MAG: prolyl oligopeptidase family serine peptidase [Gemmatimonadetes bacterium]|nr:prolyl oligopeptidase family serine peptidase [Gemmatimonadota bacterium]